MKNGIDCIRDYPGVFKNKRLGLLTSVSGVNKTLRSTVDILHECFGLSALYGPEHGVRGAMDAGALVESYTDEDTGLTVYSLYRKDSKHFLPEMLQDIDAVVYDIQDVGTRYYTYISTLLYALTDCSKHGKELIVLDRINPLGGIAVEGGVLDMRFASFVGCYPLPVRYGLTCGEFAKMANDVLQIGCNLTVVPLQGYKHRDMLCDTDLLWMMPSLGIPRFETALLYPGSCLFEGTNLSEGRGTSCPFEIIGAPWIRAAKLSAEMNRKHLPGVIFTPAYFTPSASKHKDIPCQGIHLHISDPYSFLPVRTGISLLCCIRELYPQFQLLPPVRKGSRPFISLLAGSDILEDGQHSAESIMDIWDKQAAEFAKLKKQYHLYG